MKRILLLLVLGLFLSFRVKSQNLMDKGNMLYQKGDYSGAAKEYEQILKEELVAPELYFNLGNAYYKLNNIPEAILYYEKAKKIAPADEDVDFNLRMANLKVVDKVSALPDIFYKKYYYSIVQTFSSSFWARLSIISVWLGVFCAVFFILSQAPVFKRLFFYLGLLLFLSGISCFFFAGSSYQTETASDSGVLFPTSIYVKGSPDEKSTDLFILHEGVKVKIMDELNGWKRIRISNGNEGWVPASSIQTI